MDTSEQADLLEFELDGKRIRAWVWLSVFKEGDEVEVVAEPMGDVWQGYGVRRLSDKIVALHPHCSRGRYAHYKASTKWLFIIYLTVFLFLLLVGSIRMMFKGDGDWLSFAAFMIAGGLAGLLAYAFFAWRIARKLMGFVRLAEGIFTAFGWSDVKNIDLPAITKRTKRPGDPGPLGVMYFRY
jgi:hypothetical protein